MMQKHWIFFFAALLATTTVAVQAYPNLNMTTGILAMPTAEVITAGKFVGAADVIFFDKTTVNARILYGLSNQLEVGMGIIAGTDTAVGISAKYRLPDAISGLDWAVGGSLISADAIDDGFQIFAVGTRQIAFGNADNIKLFGSIGASYTDIDTASAIRPFIGTQLFIGDSTEIAAEFVFATGDFSDSILSVLLRKQLSDRLSGQLGLTNAFGFTGTGSHAFFVGTSYTFN